MCQLNLDLLIKSIASNFNPLGNTEINEKQWSEIKMKAEKIGGALLEAINEVSPWVAENFNQYKVFTIIGM